MPVNDSNVTKTMHLTAPASATSTSTIFEWTSETITPANLANDEKITLIDEDATYKVQDQFDASIKDSDKGINTKLRIREDTPWDSSFERLTNYWKERVTTRPEWKVSADLTETGEFTDIMEITMTAEQLKELTPQIQEGTILVKLETHDWHVGVSQGNESNYHQLQITKNTFEVKCIDVQGAGDTKNFKISRKYTVNMQ